MATADTQNVDVIPEYETAIAALKAGKDSWAQTRVAERMAILVQIKDALMQVSQDWAETAAREKQIPAGSPLAGEEWITGPYALMCACNGLLQTLSEMGGKKYLDRLSSRTLVSGQLAVQVMPTNIWDRLLLSGIKAEVWMQAGVTKCNLPRNAASAYEQPSAERKGKVALVLGAGNIAAISPLDCFQKLFHENQVVILKMNPVNDYLSEFLNIALKPLIDRDALRIVKGNGAQGAYLTNHPDIEELHITGAAATHDAIVWGVGAEGDANKKAGTPKNTRPISSELGAVTPTIVVAGPWTAADIKFQAEHIATQKMHNSGFNCVSCQTLILPQNWSKTNTLMDQLKSVVSGMDPRLAYYPGSLDRRDEYASNGENVVWVERDGDAPALVMAELGVGGNDSWLRENEVFGPAMGIYHIAENDPEAYLRAAITYANDNLHGTLSANIIIHPKTIQAIGKKRFEEIVADFRYGTIGINGWTGIGFLLAQCPFGAFPGHTPEDVQSGIGSVHNSYMLENVERVVITAPWRPFPRNLLSGGTTLLPNPPWFITNKKQHILGMLLTRFQYKPGWLKLPRIALNALLG